MASTLVQRILHNRNPVVQKAATYLAPGGIYAALMEQQADQSAYCTLSFDCDFPRDIEALPGVLELLERHCVVASFACIGQWVRAYPEQHRALVAAGHEIVNHTETHPNLYHPDYDYARVSELSRERFNQIAPGERRLEIERCHETFVEVLDCAPEGFRTPHFGVLHVDDVYPVLADIGYRFSSSKVAAAPPSWGRSYRDVLASGELERILQRMGDSGIAVRTYGALVKELEGQFAAAAK